MNWNWCHARNAKANPVLVSSTTRCPILRSLCHAAYPVRVTTTYAEPITRGWTPDDTTFGARLALVRQRMGWGNVKEAAVACQLPVQSWRNWERDGVRPRNIDEIAWTIAERTGCDYGWLLAGSRLTTYAAARAAKGPEANSRYPRVPERTRPNGHPGHAKPDPSTRRPDWKRLAQAENRPDQAIPRQRGLAAKSRP